MTVPHVITDPITTKSGMTNPGNLGGVYVDFCELGDDLVEELVDVRDEMISPTLISAIHNSTIFV